MTNSMEHSSNAEPFESLSALLMNALGDDVFSSSAENLLDLMTDDVLFEFPFPMPRGIRSIRGKAALRDYLPKVDAALSIESLSLTRAFLSQDRQTAVVEFSCRGCSKTGDARYDQNYVSLIDLRDGLICRYRDYWNPLIAVAALGQSELANADQAHVTATTDAPPST